MSKRKKKKFKPQQYLQSQPASPISQAVATPAQVYRPEPPKQAPVKVAPSSDPAYASHAREYRQVQSDLIWVGVVNGALLVLTLAAYYINKSSGFLDTLYSRVF